MSKWKIDRRGPGCHACERTFEDGERHACSLTLTDEETLERRDLCSSCWQGDAAPERAADLFWWFTRHQDAKTQSVSLDLDSLEQLFLQLEGKGERAVRELRYVLCLLLMRKRRIKVERVLRDAEGESFLVKRPRRDQRYKVFVYDFTPERMSEIRDELQAIFDGAEAAGISLAEAQESAPAGTDEEIAQAAQAESMSDAGDLDAGDPELRDDSTEESGEVSEPVVDSVAEDDAALDSELAKS